VAGAAELRGVHHLDPLEAGGAEDHHVGQREPGEEGQAPAGAGVVQVEDRQRLQPLGARAAAGEPGAQRHEEQPEHEEGGQDEERQHAHVRPQLDAGHADQDEQHDQEAAGGGEDRTGQPEAGTDEALEELPHGEPPHDVGPGAAAGQNAAGILTGDR